MKEVMGGDEGGAMVTKGDEGVGTHLTFGDQTCFQRAQALGLCKTADPYTSNENMKTTSKRLNSLKF